MQDDLGRAREIRAQLLPGQKIVFVSGVLNVIHSGHIRLLNFAKENGDVLVVGVLPDGYPGGVLEQSLRLEAVSSLTVVDHALIVSGSLEEFLSELLPAVVVKGKEHEDKFNHETDVLERNNGKLIFATSDQRFSFADGMNEHINQSPVASISKPTGYLDRHNFDNLRSVELVKAFSDLSVLVVGDLIIDDYVDCVPLGMSQEDPTLVVSPLQSEKYLGGAGIVAAHASCLKASSHFVTIVGEDEAANFALDRFAEYGVSHSVIMDASRPTTLKQRYRANGKSMLRVNHLRQHDASEDVRRALLARIEPRLNNTDLLVFSDFSYGCLPQMLVNDICRLCRQHEVMMVADSQSSSQLGDISRFVGMNLVTPTEREIRLALRDFKSGLVETVAKLQGTSLSKNVIVTLGPEGVLVQTNPESDVELRTDRLVAMNSSPKDVAGAGDSLLVSSAMALAAGATIWEAAFIGSLAAAIQVSRVGNIPLDADELLREIAR